MFSQTRDRVLDELRAEPGKAEVVNRLEGILLHIAFDETHVADALQLGLLAAKLEKPIAAIDRKHRS